jgi:GH24 family phage-related lysozyme (muramidase)
MDLADNLKPSTFKNLAIVADMNANNYQDATKIWQNFAAPLPGIVARRAAEVNLFLTGTYSNHQ